MRTYQNVYLSLGKVLQDGRRLLSAAGTRQIVHTDRQVFQSAGESLEVLIGQHSGRYQHGHLLRVARSLEGSTHGDFRLAKAHVATHQTVHGTRLLHICLYVVSGLQLIGGVFIEESCLQFVLQEGVWREGKTLLLATGRIQLYQVAGNVLQFLLSALLHALPLPRTQMRQTWRLATILRLVLRHLI